MIVVILFADKAKDILAMYNLNSNLLMRWGIKAIKLVIIALPHLSSHKSGVYFPYAGHIHNTCRVTGGICAHSLE